MKMRLYISCFLVCCCLYASAQDKSATYETSGKAYTALRRTFYEGLQFKNTGKINTAKERFEKVIAMDPQCDPALYELAAINLAAENIGLAEDYIGRALNVNDKNKWYWLVYVEVQKKNKQAPQLLNAFNKLISLDPDNNTYYFDKAVTLQMLNRNTEADSVYKLIENRFGPSGELTQARKSFNAVTSGNEERINKLEQLYQQKSKKIDVYLDLADYYLRNGQTDRAYEVLKSGKKRFRDNLFIHLLLADYYNVTGDTRMAQSESLLAFVNAGLSVDVKIKIVLSNFPRIKEEGVLKNMTELSEAIIKAHPTEGKAYALYGDLLVQHDRLKEAIVTYRKAVSLNDKIFPIWNQLLQLEAYVGDQQGLYVDAQKAVIAFPDEPDPYYFASMGLIQSSENEKAVGYLKKALSLSVKRQIPEAEFYSSLGTALNSLKRYAEADEAFEKSLKLQPDNFLTLNNFAYYLSIRKEKLAEAEQMARRANELKPDMASLEDTYAWVLFCLQKYTDARIWIEKAIKNNADSATQYEHYGDILFHLGEADLALKQWITARDKGIKTKTLEKKINEKNFFE